ncbi:MAG: LysE family translocator [Rhodobacteraceae bacterium]|nr:LysE family translocator [Paracoccaceae bacterium]
MIDPVVLLAYVPASVALNLTPGADMMFCLGQGLRGGPRAAMAANLGIALGSFVHVLVAGLGLGAAVATHPALFDVIRWAGVAYLVWLAWGALRASGLPEVPPVSPRRAFRQGLAVNLTNPKVILFVLAFIPQFVDPARAILPQFLIFGGIIALGGLVVNGGVGLAAGGAAGRLMRSARFATWLGRVSAAIFGGLALRLALIQRG